MPLDLTLDAPTVVKATIMTHPKHSDTAAPLPLTREDYQSRLENLRWRLWQQEQLGV